MAILEVKDLDVDYGLLDPDSALAYALTTQMGWTKIAGDDDFVLLKPSSQ